MEQAAIALTGVIAIYLTQSASAQQRRFACLFGLAGQPFWMYAPSTCLTVNFPTSHTLSHTLTGGWQHTHVD